MAHPGLCLWASFAPPVILASSPLPQAFTNPLSFWRRIVQTDRTAEPSEPWPKPIIRGAILVGVPSLMTLVSALSWSARTLIPDPAHRSLFDRARGVVPLAPRHPRFLNFMFRHFMLSFDSIAGGRPWTLITSALNHANLSHLLGNLFTIVPTLALAVDPRMGIALSEIAELMIGSALACSLATMSGLVVPTTFAGRTTLSGQGRVAMGSSGIAYGLMVYMSFMARKSLDAVRVRGLSFYVTPLPTVAIILLRELVMLLRMQVKPNQKEIVGHAGHLAGAAFGLVFYWMRTKRLLPRSWYPEPQAEEDADGTKNPFASTSRKGR